MSEPPRSSSPSPSWAPRSWPRGSSRRQTERDHAGQATLSGLGQTGTSSFCFLFGTTTPFSADTLAALYPTHRQFVARWTAATASSVAAGFIRPADGVELAVAAYRSTVGGQG